MTVPRAMTVVALTRDRAFEKTCIRALAGSLGVDVEPLIAFAARRAEQGQADYGRDFPDLERDLEQEVLDEIGDGVNYVVWRLDAIRRGLARGDVDQLQLALKHLAFAFEAIRR